MSQSHGGPNPASPTGMPRWVKAFGVIVIILVLLFVALHVTGGGFGGPGRHTPPPSVGEHVVQQP